MKAKCHNNVTENVTLLQVVTSVTVSLVLRESNVRIRSTNVSLTLASMEEHVQIL